MGDGRNPGTGRNKAGGRRVGPRGPRRRPEPTDIGPNGFWLRRGLERSLVARRGRPAGSGRDNTVDSRARPPRRRQRGLVQTVELEGAYWYPQCPAQGGQGRSGDRGRQLGTVSRRLLRRLPKVAGLGGTGAADASWGAPPARAASRAAA